MRSLAILLLLLNSCTGAYYQRQSNIFDDSSKVDTTARQKHEALADDDSPGLLRRIYCMVFGCPEPSEAPSMIPSAWSSLAPTEEPSAQPSSIISMRPSKEPSVAPSEAVSAQPSSTLSMVPSEEASMAPSRVVSGISSTIPSMTISMTPSTTLSGVPSMSFSERTSAIHSHAPFKAHSAVPILWPTPSPTCDDDRLVPPPLAGKKGIGLTLREPNHPKGGTWDINLPKLLALNVSWNYSWNHNRIDLQADHIEFMPMIWGAKTPTKLVEKLNDIVLPQFEAGLTLRLLGFTIPHSAGMTFEQAVTAWYLMQNTSIPLTSPSPAKRLGTWMGEFMNRAQEDCLRMEYLRVHWYSGPNFVNFQHAMYTSFTVHGGTRVL